MNLILDILLVSITVAVTCSLLGVFLVLRGNSMITDAISHTVLLGIVLTFFVVPNFDSPLLIIGATLMGVITVWLTEALYGTKRLNHDTSIGLVFPLLFSIAVILISQFASNIHLDVDVVIMGELGFTPFTRLIIGGYDFGPTAFWRMLIILIINIIFITLFYKQLKITTFDPEFALSIGISPTLIYYGLMTLVSLTSVGAYDSVGSILTVGLFVGPPVTAYLLTNKLKPMIILSIAFAIFNSVAGVFISILFDTNFAGMIATVTGFTAFIVFVGVFIKNKVQNKHLSYN